MARELFRKESLERLSSPEQLDALMQVTTPVGWIALCGAGVILLATVLWSIFGTIPIKVRGQGLIMSPSGVFTIIAKSDGVVQELKVEEWDSVKKGELIAQIARPKLAREITKSKTLLGKLQEEYDELIALNKQETELDKLLPKHERTKVEAKLESLFRTRKDIQDVNELAMRIIEARSALDMLEFEYKETTQIISPYNGVVLELDVGEGETVAEGSACLKIEIIRQGEDLQGLLYFTRTEGKTIQKGMQVQIDPRIINQEEYGYMQAVIEDVSKFPVSRKALMKVLQNDELVNTIMEAGAPIAAVASLTKDTATFSGYRWSSVKGPPVKVYSGTWCQALIIIAEKRPIEFVIPHLGKSVPSK